MNHSHLFVVPDPPARHLVAVDADPLARVYKFTPFGLMTDAELRYGIACSCGDTGVCTVCVMADLEGGDAA